MIQLHKDFSLESKHIKKEFFRKSIHICSAFLPFFFTHFYKQTLIFLICILFLYVLFEIARNSGKKIPLISRITEFASRARDENKFVLGPVTLVLGIILCAIFFDGEARAIGIYALSFGDGLASIAGKLFGKNVIPYTNGKTLEGSLTCFFATLLSSFFVCKNIFISFICALAGMVIEIIPLKDFDNLIIPICISSVAHFLLP